MKLKFNSKSILLSLMFAITYVFIALTIPTNYAVLLPHTTRSTNAMITIDGGTFTGNLHTVSVWNSEKLTPIGRMIYELNAKNDVYEMSTYSTQLTALERNLRGEIQKQASFEQSIITAYTLASEEVSTISIDYELTGMIIDYREVKHNQLNIGDIIIDVDNKNFNDYQQMGQYFIENHKLELKVLRKGTVQTIALEKTADSVFQFYPKYEIKGSNPSYEVPGNKVNTGGPSGGMMYTLSIYFALIGYDKIDEIIAGTGTIRYNNTVGQIGGLVQKLYGVEKKGIKHFIVPNSQYAELVGTDHDVNLYPVTDINDAIRVIRNIFE